MTKFSSSIRTVALCATLMVIAAGCSRDVAQPWHYWIAPLLVFSGLFLVLFAGPLAYYRKVWRLKHRGR